MSLVLQTKLRLTEQDSSVIQDWNLGSLSRVSGRVVQADGITPIENASVNLAVDGLPVATINTDADGYYDVRVLRPGTYDLWAATFGASFSPHLNVDITATTDLLGLNFRAGSESVSGRVLDELFQQPIGDATVHISVPGLGLLGTVNETQTDEEGVFSFSSISPGIYELQIETRNLAPIIYSLEVTDASSGTGETPSIYESFFLGPSRRIYGRVVDTDDGEPVAEALVTVSGTTQRGGIFRRQVATDADGNWEMDAPVLQATSGSSGSPDTYSVTIAAPDYEQSTETYTTGPKRWVVRIAQRFAHRLNHLGSAINSDILDEHTGDDGKRSRGATRRSRRSSCVAGVREFDRGLFWAAKQRSGLHNYGHCLRIGTEINDRPFADDSKSAGEDGAVYR